jgi:polyhydroxyalkanoate synthesis regulator phasin
VSGGAGRAYEPFQANMEKRSGISEGIRTGIGILTAFKEAIEETLEDAVKRGDLSPERAKSAMKEAADRVQETLEEARERVDFVPRKEFEALREEVAELRRRLGQVEGASATGAPPAASGGQGSAGEGAVYPVD